MTQQTAPVAAPGTRGRRAPAAERRQRSQRPLIALLLGIPTAYVAFFLGFPVAKAIYLSFTNLALSGPAAANPQFTGVSNYVTLFTSGQFWSSLKDSLEYLGGSAIVGQVMLGFLLAVFVSRLPKVARSLLLGVMVLAWVIPEIVVAFIWSGFLSTPSGLANVLFHLVGLGPVAWLYKQPMLSLVIANFWRGTAFSVLVLGAALQAVPKDVVEAARLDGASEWALLRRVQVPLIRTALATVLALTTLWTLSDFTLIFVLTGGGPSNATNVLPIYTYRTSFSFYELGYGTAVSLVLLLIACGLAYFYVRVGSADVRGSARVH